MHECTDFESSNQDGFNVNRIHLTWGESCIFCFAHVGKHDVSHVETVCLLSMHSYP